MVTGFRIGITQNSQSVAGNKSNVTVALTITWNGGSYNATGNAAGVLNIDGIDYSFTAKFNTAQKTTGSEVIFSKTLDISHSPDGSKTLACSASFATGTGAGTVTATGAKTLTQIPRESTIGATDANIGATSVISVSRKNAAYTHCIAYSFGNLKGYLADSSGALSNTAVKLSATSLSFPIPESFYAQIPNVTSGPCKLTIKTYSGDTQIGAEKSCTFTVKASMEKCCPEVSGTVTDINEATVVLTGDPHILVRGMSTAHCTVTAQAKNGAALKSKSIDGKPVEGNALDIAAVERGSIFFSATDTRGYTGGYTKDMETVEYVPVTCNAELARTNPTDGNARLRISGNYFNGTFGAQDNSLQLRYQAGNGEIKEIVPVVEENRYFATVDLTGMDYRTSHSITVTVQDKLMTLTKDLTLGKGIPVFDWGEEDFSFHVPVTAAQGINGVYLGSRYVDGVNLLAIQSEVDCFDSTGKGRQTFFITGSANGLPVYGFVGVWLKNGNTFISGTGILSATADQETGQVNVAFDTTPWDTFTVISNRPFQLI